MERLRDDALAIWQAGVDAVRSDKLVRDVVDCADGRLTICGRQFELAELGRIAVVGAGKAGAGMAAALEEALGHGVVDEKVEGWVNVPGDCVRPLQRIHLHPGRPAGLNEPTEEGVAGARRILDIVESLSADDLSIVLISGGGSALLPSPIPPVTLQDKQAVTRFLMHAGATIQELNTVRKRLSQIKGGGLARACKAGRLIGLIISDIIGDPLDLIASGPTYPDAATDAEALAILEKLGAAPPEVPAAVIDYLRAASAKTVSPQPFPAGVENHVIGHNQTALEAAAAKARGLGYHVISLGSDNAGEANAEGRSLAQRCLQLRQDESSPLPACILSGGEPVVHLAQTDRPRKGGRNQQLVLAGLEALATVGLERIALLSGGTDGEDGPTDAAGAVADQELLETARALGLDPQPYLEINNAYAFFEQAGGLVITGPTHTNVMDLRVALVGA